MLALFLLLSLPDVLTAGECLRGSVLDASATPHRCLHLVHSLQTYNDANLMCASLGGTLVSIGNAFVQAFLVSEAHEKLAIDDYWIGLTNTLDVNSWLWDDGTPFNFQNWQIDPSTNDPVNNNCAAGRLSTGKWYNLDCGSKRSFVCESQPSTFTPETEPTSRCPSFASDGTAFGKCYVPFNAELTYNDAQVVCASLDGDPVSINNLTEMVLVAGSAKGSLGTRKEYWIGLNNFFDGTHWQWAGDTESNYTNWANGSPSANATIANGCVSAAVKTGKWQNKECASLLTFICEVPPIAVPASTLAPTPSPTCPSCPCGGNGDWIYFPLTDSLYLGIVHDGNGSAFDALEQRCQAMGAHLASLHSIEEQHFVIGLGFVVKNDWEIAIGYRSYTDVSGFHWTDGTPFDFGRWQKGEEPTNAYLCTQLWKEYEGFVSNFCDNNYPFPGICKKPYK